MSRRMVCLIEDEFFIRIVSKYFCFGIGFCMLNLKNAILAFIFSAIKMRLR